MTKLRFTLAVAIVAALLVPVGSADGQEGSGYETRSRMGSIRFPVEVRAIPGGDDGGRLEVTYSVTHEALVFLREGGGFEAAYELTIILLDGDRQIAGDSWRREVRVGTYEETSSRKVAIKETLVLDAPPGRFVIRIMLESTNTRAFGLYEDVIEIAALSPGSLTVGTVVFERRSAASGSDSVGYEPNPERVFGEDFPHARARFPVYGSPGTEYVIEHSVLWQTGDREKSSRDTVVQTELSTEHTFDFGVLDLEVGYYLYEVRLRPLGDGDGSSGKARFSVITSPKSWGDDFEKMLAQVSIVASRDEYDVLIEAEPEDRDAAWEEFWRGRDPSPGTPENEFRDEFMRRLAYVNTHFRTIIEGWQTDMGRIYIEYGAPDDIDSQPIGKMLNAWEIWFYYEHHTKYVFVDREGFGEYKLVEASRI
jgi:GWxTD domain-containing protein